MVNNVTTSKEEANEIFNELTYYIKKEYPFNDFIFKNIFNNSEKSKYFKILDLELLSNKRVFLDLPFEIK
jgi:hypothetical protein